MKLDIGSIVNLEEARHEFTVKPLGYDFMLTDREGINYFAHRANGILKVYAHSKTGNREAA